METRKRMTETRKSEVQLMSLAHKIARKAGLARQLADSWAEYCAEDNWLREDDIMRRIESLEEAFDETVATPVGGYVRRYI